MTLTLAVTIPERLPPASNASRDFTGRGRDGAGHSADGPPWLGAAAWDSAPPRKAPPGPRGAARPPLRARVPSIIVPPPLGVLETPCGYVEVGWWLTAGGRVSKKIGGADFRGLKIGVWVGVGL